MGEMSTNQRETGTCPTRISALRYIIVVLATSVSATTLACSYSFNFAVVCRVNGSSDIRSIYLNNSESPPVMYFPSPWDNILYSAYPLGVFLALLAIFIWKGFNRMSVRYSVFVSSAISALLTLAIPPAFDLSPYTTFPLKVLQGAFVAPTIPLVGHITACWAPKSEIGMFVSILSSYSQIGLFWLMLTSGVLCDTFAWRGIFLFHGTFGLLISVLWFVFHRDDPHLHPWLETQELEMIEKNRTVAETATKAPVPLREMLSDRSVWACLVASLGNYNGVSPFIIFASLLLKKSLNLSDLVASQFNAFSYALQLALKLISGKLSDVLDIAETAKLRLFNTLSCGLCGLLICITGFIPEKYKYICASMIVLFQGIIGFNSAGFNRAAVVVGRQHAHAILTMYGLIMTFSTFLQPFLVVWIAPSGSWSEWFPLFELHGLILIVSNIYFCIFIRGKSGRFTELSAQEIPLNPK